MKVLIDMNLSPQWVEIFQRKGWESVHWSTIGNPQATDREILRWAKDNSYIVFTHDLDFGAILAATGADSPSVIQIRTQDVSPVNLEGLLIAVMEQHETRLEEGSLIVIDQAKARVRILPLKP
jgi:predicted nuclease of predicted toxin-antitoxin system